jgi:hypothetical protein
MGMGIPKSQNRIYFFMAISLSPGQAPLNGGEYPHGKNPAEFPFVERNQER